MLKIEDIVAFQRAFAEQACTLTDVYAVTEGLKSHFAAIGGHINTEYVLQWLET